MAKGKVQVDLVAKDEASAKIKGVAGHSDDLKKSFLAVAAAAVAMAGAVTAAVGKMLNDWATAGDEVAKMAKRTQWSVESLSELAYAAKIAGMDLSQFELGTRKLSGAIFDAKAGMVTYTRAFEALGLNVDDLSKMGIEEQFWAVAYALANLTDDSTRAALAVDLFGRTGTNLFPLLAEGADGIADLRTKAHDLGVTFDSESAVAAEEFKDSMTDLNTALDGVKYALVDGLGPEITNLINDHIMPAIASLRDFIKENDDLKESFMAFARGLGYVIDQLVKLIETLSKIDAATPDWLAKFSPLSLITGRTGREAGEEYRAITGKDYPMPGLTPEAVALASSAVAGGDINVIINGNVMGDEAMNRAIAQALEPYLGEASRTTSFPHVNTSGYYPGSSAR